jgi:hypothetical protein
MLKKSKVLWYLNSMTKGNKLKKGFQRDLRAIEQEQRQIAAKILGLPDPVQSYKHRKGFRRHPILNSILLGVGAYGLFSAYNIGRDWKDNRCRLGSIEAAHATSLGDEALRFLSPKFQTYSVDDEPVRLRSCQDETLGDNVILNLPRNSIVYSFRNATQSQIENPAMEQNYVPVGYNYNGRYVTGYIDARFLTRVNNTFSTTIHQYSIVPENK